MSRTCVRCGVQMNETGSLESFDGRALCVYVKKEGKKLRKSLGKVRAAVCPVCGEVSLFVSEPEDARWNG